MQFIGNPEDTIVAPATAPGVSAIAVIRLSGSDAITIANKLFQGKNLTKQASHTIHFGRMIDPDSKDVLDEVLAAIFIAPHSYTKENSVEISTHGSPFIVQKIIKTLITVGARMAQPGEFTKRAFLNGQMDLAQAEAVADLIHSDSEASHMASIHQMRGGFSKEIQKLRTELIHFASMIELELDFSEEDVEFASREKLLALVSRLLETVNPLITSFDLGNVLKNGVPTVIAGKPNAGKSTLLNKLLNEERAIVSEIPGTTRDSIEDEILIGGVQFRFIDTAGLRETEDSIEKLGVDRAKLKMEEASLLLYMFGLMERWVPSLKT
jgi:tRNA modification GTPase